MDDGLRIPFYPPSKVICTWLQCKTTTGYMVQCNVTETFPVIDHLLSGERIDLSNKCTVEEPSSHQKSYVAQTGSDVC